MKRREVESRIALASAEESLARTKARAPEVQQVTEALKNLRRENHFAEKLGNIMGGR